MYVSLQPLNGGMSLGYERVFGVPKYIISNNKTNDIYYIDYCKQRGIFESGKSKLIEMDWDLTKTFNNTDNILKELKSKDIDVVSYVPICSGLSTLNLSQDKNKKIFEADNIQNKNMYESTKFILNELKPKCAVMENAPGLYRKKGKGIRDILIEIARGAGYSVTFEFTSTMYHGIPQNRKRTFVYFWKSKNSFITEFEHKKCKTISEYLKEIPTWAKGQNIVYGNLDKDIYLKFIIDKFNIKNTNDLWKVMETKTFYANKTVARLNLYDELINWIQKNKDKLDEKRVEVILKQIEYQKTKLKNGKGIYDNSARVTCHDNYTITLTGLSTLYLLHPKKLRLMNVRELMHLMGLPHDYWNEDFIENKRVLFQSVPVTTAEHTANNVKLYLDNKLKEVNLDVVEINNIYKTVDNVSDIDMYPDIF